MSSLKVFFKRAAGKEGRAFVCTYNGFPFFVPGDQDEIHFSRTQLNGMRDSGSSIDAIHITNKPEDVVESYQIMPSSEEANPKFLAMPESQTNEQIIERQ